MVTAPGGFHQNLIQEQPMFKWLAVGAAAVVILPLTLLFLVSAAAVPGVAGTGLAGGPSALALSDIPPTYLMLYLDAAQTCPGVNIQPIHVR